MKKKKRPLSVMTAAILTAAMQTPPGTTPQMFIERPLEAAMVSVHHYIRWAGENGIKVLELSCALAPADANVSPERMADPVGYHTAILTHQDGSGQDLTSALAKEIADACKAAGVKIGTLGAFENMLHSDPKFRKQNHEHVRRAIRAAALLKKYGAGTTGVSIFVGRNTNLSIEENMRLFAEVIIPLIRYAKKHGIILYIENCPMCGWSEVDTFTHNIANTVTHWILMARMIKAAGLKGWVFINYDPSHDILQGTRPEWTFFLLKAAGVAWIIGRFHSKDLTRQLGVVAMSGFLGLRVATKQPWDRMGGPQPLPGACEHNVLAMYHGLQVDWLGMHIAIREFLPLDPENTVCTIEHEHPEFRNPKAFKSQEHHWAITEQLLLGSVSYINGIEVAAAANQQLKSVVLKKKTPWVRNRPSITCPEVIEEQAMPIIRKAQRWVLPKLPKTDQFVLGSDLK
jgi:sugar phosphate isomerase/epimerase